MVPPDLIDNAVAEIFIRLPSDEPACLVRAAAVCKTWRRVLTDQAFPRRYRELHRTPPLLGFLHNTYRSGHGQIPRFVPTAAASPFPQQALNDSSWWIMDCRHGRILFQQIHGHDYVVWDPITDVREELPRPTARQHVFRTVAVLCGVPGCDHRGCHGGPFLVIFLGTNERNFVHAWIYSSESRAWSVPVSVHSSEGCYNLDTKRGALTRDNTYFFHVGLGGRILKYELGSHSLSIINPPGLYDTRRLLMPNEDGSLGLACIKDSSLYLWSRMVNPEGIDEWIQTRVIKLDKLLPDEKFPDRVILSGFAEDVGFIYMTTHDVVYTFELNSGQVRKVSEAWKPFVAVFPFTSFYTPDFASSKLTPPVKTK